MKFHVIDIFTCLNRDRIPYTQYSPKDADGGVGRGGVDNLHHDHVVGVLLGLEYKLVIVVRRGGLNGLSLLDLGWRGERGGGEGGEGKGGREKERGW